MFPGDARAVVDHAVDCELPFTDEDLKMMYDTLDAFEAESDDWSPEAFWRFADGVLSDDIIEAIQYEWINW